MEILYLAWDDENEEKLAKHGVPAERADEVGQGPYRILRNKRHRRGQVKMVGPDFGGSFWTIVLERTSQYGVWRPVTGWRSTEGELTLYHGKGRK